MANLDKRFFTNTYITGSGRQNYLRIDELEDPLFTGFTFDMDYVSSPLFYTINYSDYGYPNVEGLGEKIELALEYMYADNMSKDQGYEILPLLSASVLDGNKLGFGLQQNVYTDMPLYGATEYIYMVDKRNGSAEQNDSAFDSNRFVDSGGNPNSLNGYNLGDSIKSIVNESDKKWAENNKTICDERVKICDDILNDQEVINEHKDNVNELNNALSAYESIKVSVDGEDGEFTELGLQQKLNECNNILEEFEQFKREIVTWANGIISGYQTRGNAIYFGNKCVQKISTYDDISDSTKDLYIEKLSKQFGTNFANEFLFKDNESFAVKFNDLYNELFNDFLIIDNGDVIIEKKYVIEKFSDKLKYFGLIKENFETYDGDIRVFETIIPPDWAMIFESHISYFSTDTSDSRETGEKIQSIMSYKCDIDLSFDDKFISEKIKECEKKQTNYEVALDEIRTLLYGYENGEICDKNNPSPNSLYGQYLDAKKKCENDDFSQAEKSKKIAESGFNEMNNMINKDEKIQSVSDYNYNKSIQNGEQPLEMSRSKSIVASQTVLDMLGFISGMKKMTIQYPYIIQGVSGLDTAYNKHYGIKDSYLGSGDDKITLTCLESLDLRVSSMFNRYFNAVYDRQYRRERVPVNLRRFNCSIYVHDIRNFVAKSRLDENGNHKTTYNRLLELTDMYYSVIEFRFFDCEIVPEETGNIFNDVSNEAPSDMKKTNFTFTYGNCVVNFVPNSEVKAHNDRQ